MTKMVVLIIVSILAWRVISVGYSTFSGEIDGIALTTNVHDGDTFHIDRNFNGSNTIRLADIDASELGQPKSYEARDFLIGLVNHKTVYLDIDDKYIFDYHGTGDRLVCVVYVSCNTTHYLNVNKALLDADLAEKKDYDNEFDPNTWALFVSKQDIVPEFASFPILTLSMVATLLGVIIYRRKYLSPRAQT
jgi:hypothetical protein